MRGETQEVVGPGELAGGVGRTALVLEDEQAARPDRPPRARLELGGVLAARDGVRDDPHAIAEDALASVLVVIDQAAAIMVAEAGDVALHRVAEQDDGARLGRREVRPSAEPRDRTGIPGSSRR